MSSLKNTKKAIFALALGALGVVYGDIGTSPLYAVREIFFSHHYHLEHSAENILGGISMILWALTITVCFKYITLVLRADNEGEGGVFALYGLLRKFESKAAFFVMGLLVFAAGLLFGDGIITPAISVLASVEGLSVLTPFFNPYIIPITIVILTALFAVQSRGTAKIGAVFGPIVGLWFLSLIALGLLHLVNYPQVLVAFNPVYAFKFLVNTPWHVTLLVLGSVMLVVTGGEAMYADMGHFGRLPIRISWFSIVYPALMINYLGQGAFLLGGGEIVEGNLFFSMVPKVFLLPMVILATCATIIASQALITGAFSLATQAVNLKFLPLLKIDHTHEEHEGQIYVPFVNWLLYIGCVILVLTFKSSSNLASAYGLAVSADMLITTLAMILISINAWKWPKPIAIGIFGSIAIMESMYLTANSLKFFSGGYFPVIVAIVFYTIMQTWNWGSRKISKVYNNMSRMTMKELVKIKSTNKFTIPKTVVILAKTARKKLNDGVPFVQQVLWDRYNCLPKNIIFLTVISTKSPHVEKKERYEVKKFYSDKKMGSIYTVIIRHGFMEELDLEEELLKIAEHEHLAIDHNPSEWLVSASSERIALGKMKSLFSKVRGQLFKLLFRNSATLDQYWGLGRESQLSIEVIPIRLQEV